MQKLKCWKKNAMSGNLALRVLNGLRAGRGNRPRLRSGADVSQKSRTVYDIRPNFDEEG
jgi:hypothetical protein